MIGQLIYVISLDGDIAGHNINIFKNLCGYVLGLCHS